MNDLRTPTLLITALFAVAGCGGGDGAEEVAQPAAETAVADLDEATLQKLMASYPVLRETPAPQPTPGPDGTVVPASEILETAQGEATFYADAFEGRRTASGIPFRQNQYVAAHQAFPFGTLLRVTNLRNDRSVNVRVVDRGPHGATARERNTIIDLSRRAAEDLGYIEQGRTPVRVDVLEWGEGIPRAS